MFPGQEDGGGRAGKRGGRALLGHDRDGGAGGDGDGDEAGARQPGCGLYFLGFRRRRSRIAATTGDAACNDLSPQELGDEIPSQPRVRTDLLPQDVDAELRSQPRTWAGTLTRDLPTQGEDNQWRRAGDPRLISMFLGQKDGGGHADEWEDRTLLGPGRGGGADGDEDNDEEVGAEICMQQRVCTVTVPCDMPTHDKEPPELSTAIDCLIVAKLFSLVDRCALQGVSQRWRRATRKCKSPPLPLLLNADYTISNCFAQGPRCALLPMNSRSPHPRGYEVTCLGSLNNWVGLAYDEWNPQENLALPHKLCHLVQPVKGRRLPLPSPCSFEMEGVAGSLPITGTNGRFTYYQPGKTGSLRLMKLVMCHLKNPADCKVVGLATQRGSEHIVFTTPMMSSWYICSAGFITAGSDIEFLQDKLLILGSDQQEIYQLDFGPDMSFFPVVCEVKRCIVMELPQLENTHQQLNFVRSSGDLLLVARYFTLNMEQLNAVRVFLLDPVSWTWQQIQTLGDRSILVSLSCSQAIDTAGLTDPKADHVYFLDQFCPNFFSGEGDDFSYRSQVFNMGEGTVSELLIGSLQGTRRPGFPMWFFPTM